MSGVGGIGLALAYVAKEGRVRALNFSVQGRPSPPSPKPSPTSPRAPASWRPWSPATWQAGITLHETYGTLDRETPLRPRHRLR